LQQRVGFTCDALAVDGSLYGQQHSAAQFSTAHLQCVTFLHSMIAIKTLLFSLEITLLPSIFSSLSREADSKRRFIPKDALFHNYKK
jgi:uncharacterized protein YfaA (DUF2138 family)